jgi:hypothetical protein
MFAVLHANDVIPRFLPGGVDIPAKDGPGAIQFGMEVLMHLRLAGPLQQILRRTANECSIRPPRNLNELTVPSPLPPRQVYHMENLIDAGNP